ncbi:TIR domain-containing protein [Sphingomonas sp. RB56-2]|uniref:TIR domain-containing protein n=1 Tax=Sphingomonas brevis TaxID=2908206 RepID=A0ABT0S8I7_9SPHN|nr:TIR domain-containing protein [Sphingomonas brevis]
MNEPQALDSEDRELSRPVFVSYATADRKEALSVCKGLERRGTPCWISTRDVAPGENYQEAIVHALRDARAMVLVFSEAANNSDEIKKELSLASRYHIPVMALRIEDVEPHDAFAYELSTRQWIDAFTSWDKSIDSLVQHIGKVSHAPSGNGSVEHATSHRRAKSKSNRTLMAAAAAALLLAIVAGAWWAFRPASVAAHSMVVRLTGFSSLSPDLPKGMPDAIRDEIIAAFNDDGVVGVSTASAPPPGNAPAYALSGTVRHDGDKIKVNVRLTDERSATTLWSNIFSYDSDDAARIPRHVAVDAGNMTRCGLFAASTYPKALPNPVLTDYLSYCHNAGYVQYEPGKALDLATKVVAAVPDFSWGWSAVAVAADMNGYDNPTGPRYAAFEKQASEAADKAIELDKTNSEALLIKAWQTKAGDFVTREKWFQAALAARPLACGCEHHSYGNMLLAVGRTAAAADEYRRSTDVLALDSNSQLNLAEALLLQGKTDQAKSHIESGIELSSEPGVKENIDTLAAAITGDYAAALTALQSPKLDLPGPMKAALRTGFQAMVSGNSANKAQAVQTLMALPPDMKRRRVTTLLGALGAKREALQLVGENLRLGRTDAASWLFMPSMGGAIRDPEFPAFATKYGLMTYWKTTHTKPDLCSARDAPSFCQLI